MPHLKAGHLILWKYKGNHKIHMENNVPLKIDFNKIIVFLKGND